MEKLLEEGLFGSGNSSALDCACFCDRGEFRRPDHFARSKRKVAIQELDGRSRFLSDIWKRFVT